MITFTVLPHNKEWSVSYDYGEQGYNELFRFKFYAVLHARLQAKKLAAQGTPVSVRVKDRRGRFQSEWTYPRSADPRRSPG